MLAGVCRVLAALAIASISFAAVAQVIPPSDLPGRERERFTLPTGPAAQPGGAVIALPGAQAPPGADKVKLKVRGIEISGAKVYSKAQLAETYTDIVGRTVTIQDIYDLAQRITAKYGSDGYVLSRAVVPPQQLSPSGAVVRIQIVEGYIDTVQWPAALSSYRNFFSYYADRITSERPANIRTIERYLLLAGDLPGLKFKNSIKPHPSKPGAAILIVEVTEKPVDWFNRADNRGTKARGPLEYLTSASFNNFLRSHDSLTLTAAGAFTVQELQYYDVNYRQVLTPEGLTAFFDASDGFGRPGTEELQLLRYRTNSLYLQTGLSFPIIRRREANLTVTGLAFATDDRSSILDMPDTPPSTQDRLRGLRGKVDGDFADRFNGINQANLTVSQGFIGLGSTTNFNDLASRANGRVDFSKVELLVSRLQPLVANFSLLTAAYGQYAFTPLLVSELCGYGGRQFGRAFDPSQFVSDSCLEVLGELRYDVPIALKDITQTQLYVYADHGRLHNIAPVLGTFSDVDAGSIGAGLRLGWLTYLTADFSVAHIVQGQNLTGTGGALPLGVVIGQQKGTRAFVILTGKL